MTPRTQLLFRRLLAYLLELDGTPVMPTIIHATIALNMVPAVRLTEFEALIADADTRGWITSIRSGITQQEKWVISDKGRAALAEFLIS